MNILFPICSIKGYMLNKIKKIQIFFLTTTSHVSLSLHLPLTFPTIISCTHKNLYLFIAVSLQFSDLYFENCHVRVLYHILCPCMWFLGGTSFTPNCFRVFKKTNGWDMTAASKTITKGITSLEVTLFLDFIWLTNLVFFGSKYCFRFSTQ